MTHYEVLPAVQKEVLDQLVPARRLGYALYGGTAIALQLGHRESIDFDFFTDRPLDEEKLKQAMPMLEAAVTTQREANTWTTSVRAKKTGGMVKLSFFGGLSFGRVGNPSSTKARELTLASLDDLLGHKLKVLLQRVEAKDYLDIAAMLKAGQSLEKGLGAAESLFPNFPAAESLRALTYFEGGNLASVGKEDRRLLVEAVRHVGKPLYTPIVSRQLGMPPQPGGPQNGLPPLDFGR